MARRRIPTVGTKGLHVAQLTPEVRSLLHHRAQREAHREFAPTLAADRTAFGAANRGYRREARSIRGATNMVESELGQALAGLKGSGLSGRYLQQARSEFTSRAADAASAIPALLAGAREERSDALAEAQQKLLGDRASQQGSAAQKFNSALRSQRDKASTILKERAEKVASKSGVEFDPKALANADIALKDALTTWQKNPEVKGPDGNTVPVQELNPLRAVGDWRGLAQQMTKLYDGFDLAEAWEVIKRRLMQRKAGTSSPYAPTQWGKVAERSNGG
ncbi:MAG: hypothetical protein ACRDLL_03360 [Solirubrobacterales bacterium]